MIMVHWVCLQATVLQKHGREGKLACNGVSSCNSNMGKQINHYLELRDKDDSERRKFQENHHRSRQEMGMSSAREKWFVEKKQGGGGKRGCCC